MSGDSDEARSRRITESQARARSADTRQAMLDLLREGPMSSVELRARLADETPMSVVNYHLNVLVNAGEVVDDGDLYRLP